MNLGDTATLGNLQVGSCSFVDCCPLKFCCSRLNQARLSFRLSVAKFEQGKQLPMGNQSLNMAAVFL